MNTLPMIERVWLPKDIHGCTEEDLNRVGIFVEGDFSAQAMAVTLPPGWRLEVKTWESSAAPHTQRWTYLLDPRDRKRAVVTRDFDGSGEGKLTLYWFRRYAIDVYPVGGWDADLPIRAFVYAVVNSDSKVIHTSLPLDVLAAGQEATIYGQAIDAGAAWLFAHYPDWQDIHAYWQ